MKSDTGALTLQGVGRHFSQGENRLTILKDVNVSIVPGEMVALIAPSGAGKSTLLQIAGLLDRPNEGEVFIGGKACGRLDDAGRTEMRRKAIGFVYQFHHLLPEFSAIENVALPQMILGRTRKDAEKRAAELLEFMRIGKRGEHRPAELSGGEQQRVAIARAVANAPHLLLADEPTGNLDPTTSGYVFDALTQLVRRSGVAALIATHNHELAARMDRAVTIQDGAVVETRVGTSA